MTARKPDATRRRRNLDSRSITISDEARWKGKIPSLPTIQTPWTAELRTWWKAIWTSPMSSLWTASDIEPLRRLALLKLAAQGILDGSGVLDLVKDLKDGGKTINVQVKVPLGTLREIAALEDRFGLNPKARRAMGVEILPAAPKPTPTPTGVSSLDERRRRLSTN